MKPLKAMNYCRHISQQTADNYHKLWPEWHLIWRHLSYWGDWEDIEQSDRWINKLFASFVAFNASDGQQNKVKTRQQLWSMLISLVSQPLICLNQCQSTQWPAIRHIDSGEVVSQVMSQNKRINASLVNCLCNACPMRSNVGAGYHLLSHWCYFMDPSPDTTPQISSISLRSGATLEPWNTAPERLIYFADISPQKPLQRTFGMPLRLESVANRCFRCHQTISSPAIRFEYFFVITTDR